MVPTPPLLAALQRVNAESIYNLWNGEHSAVVELQTSCSDLRTLEGVGLKIGPNEFWNDGPWVCHKIEVLQQSARYPVGAMRYLEMSWQVRTEDRHPQWTCFDGDTKKKRWRR